MGNRSTSQVTKMVRPAASPANPQPLNMRHVMQNNKALNFARTSLSVLAGIGAGILGLTGLYGFLVSGVLSLYYVLAESRSDSKHFLQKSQVLTAFVFEHLFTYILMWTLVFGSVHVY